ncbi:Ankyrin repeat and zinc finger domain containing 1 [Seminavis robusta]|uniref:Ankyrin repeat and zinc finger domain containing 1 n=1 Tax=Seminavis robusta TaxID=568900 RepID=A0A9N8DA32_9STRA|nr:Ankyrin repeat and zinc finger domain containing 1 [Seminavis robusta]|eukprot:Sro13_g009670.1 Ankyrin repeat and zinc finger domain containing 1 (649) ;mRNA; r:3057-5003
MNNGQDTIKVGSLVDTLYLYSDQCPVLLRQALALEDSAKAAADNATRRRKQEDSSDDEEADTAGVASSSSSSSEGEEEEEGTAKSGETESGDTSTTAAKSEAPPTNTSSSNSQPKPKKKSKAKPTQTEQQRNFTVKKFVENLICDAMPIHDAEAVLLPTALLSKGQDSDIAERHYVPKSPCQEYLTLSQAAQENHVLVLLLRSGRFAAGIFSKSKCLVHRACQRYTVRKGQGKAQSTQDAKGRPKSMGAQLRRQGEENLQQDITETMLQWKPHIDKCALILLSCPKGMKKYLFDALDEADVGIGKKDSRLRRLPLDIGKPSFENVCIAHQVMMTVQVRQWTRVDDAAVTNEEGTVSQPPAQQQQQQKETVEEKPAIIFPLTPLHKACHEGNLSRVIELLADKEQVVASTDKEEETSLTVEQMINRRVGPDFMTCLHYAAEAASIQRQSEQQPQPDEGQTNTVDNETAASIVIHLLVEGHADPSIVDARSRPPYFLASHDKIRDAFRMARATLGEDYCKWDTKAKVGPALTVDDLQAKKDREAEKKRKKRARQKQKKAEEKAQAEHDQRQRELAEVARKQEEDAKRVRDGLQPKAAGGNACDFCQVVVKGRKRKDMFSRLDYVYCSSECVQKHKRELMAAAAMSRSGGS